MTQNYAFHIPLAELVWSTSKGTTILDKMDNEYYTLLLRITKMYPEVCACVPKNFMTIIKHFRNTNNIDHHAKYFEKNMSKFTKSAASNNTEDKNVRIDEYIESLRSSAKNEEYITKYITDLSCQNEWTNALIGLAIYFNTFQIPPLYAQDVEKLKNKCVENCIDGMLKIEFLENDLNIKYDLAYYILCYMENTNVMQHGSSIRTSFICN